MGRRSGSERFRDRALSQPYLKESLKKKAKELGDRNVEGDEKFAALVIANSTVQAACAACPTELEQWVAAADKELKTLLDRGVIRIVPLEELDGREDCEVVPSLCIWSRKDPKDGNSGIKKARLVACGNYQTPLQHEDNSIQGYYSSTASLLMWRCLIVSFVQSKGACACVDTREAFTQTDAEAADEKHLKTFLRLPSQWKTLLIPTLAEKIGEGKDPRKFLLEVIKSIYGEQSAPALWQATLERLLKELGFHSHELEEGVYVRTSAEGVPCIVSTYVDDLWIFSLDGIEVAKVLEEITSKLQSTKAQWLFGTPRYFFEGEKSDGELSETERSHRGIFEPLTGEYRWAVAQRDSALSYVGIQVYFEGDSSF